MPLVDAPARFVPQIAVTFGGAGTPALAVDQSQPLPTRHISLAAESTPLTGATDTDGVIGPFTPDMNRAIWVTLSGDWTGRATLLRSTDGGATKLPITTIDGVTKAKWTGNVNAAVTEETVAGATYFLDISMSAGTLNYEVRQ